MAKQTKAKTSQKASPKAQEPEELEEVEKVEEVKVEEVKVEEVITYKKEFWAKQVRLNGRTITGEVIESDKQEFLQACKKNGIKIIYDNWFVKDDWRDRVFKKKLAKKTRP